MLAETRSTKDRVLALAGPDRHALIRAEGHGPSLGYVPRCLQARDESIRRLVEHLLGHEPLPFTHTPGLPVEAAGPGPLPAMSASATVPVTAGLLWFRRRDIGSR